MRRSVGKGRVQSNGRKSLAKARAKPKTRPSRRAISRRNGSCEDKGPTAATAARAKKRSPPKARAPAAVANRCHRRTDSRTQAQRGRSGQPEAEKVSVPTLAEAFGKAHDRLDSRLQALQEREDNVRRDAAAREEQLRKLWAEDMEALRRQAADRENSLLQQLFDEAQRRATVEGQLEVLMTPSLQIKTGQDSSLMGCSRGLATDRKADVTALRAPKAWKTENEIDEGQGKDLDEEASDDPAVALCRAKTEAEPQDRSLAQQVL